jgi:hypothetical protein
VSYLYPRSYTPREIGVCVCVCEPSVYASICYLPHDPTHTHTHEHTHATLRSDISMRDIFMPESKSTKTILYGLINFIRFREDRMITFGEFTQRSEVCVCVCVCV